MTFRVSRPDAVARLGLLEDLPGTWVGGGFNLITIPDKQHDGVPILILNSTRETQTFTPLGAEVPNRGSAQGDIHLQALSYVQRVTELPSNSAIHFENGLWIHVPATTVPAAKETYVRQASVPHGDSLLAQSVSFDTLKGKPKIEQVNLVSFMDEIPALNASPAKPDMTPDEFVKRFMNVPPRMEYLPAGLDAAATIKNPALVLVAALKGQTVKQTVEIRISTVTDTPGAAGILNIPFAVANANATQLDAIYWIETVQHPNGTGEFLQLQYVQRVILDFKKHSWPHISVATLVKQ